MTKVEMLTEAASGTLHPQYTQKEAFFTPYPFNDQTGGTARRSYAYIRILQKIGDPEHIHATVIAYEGNEFYSWCSDTFLNGKMPATKAKANIALVAKDVAEKSAMTKLFGYVAEKGCRFWAGKKCSHHSDTMAHLDGNTDILDRLIEGFNGTKTAPSRRSEEELLKKYAFKKHIKLEGDKGSGKTTIAHAIADNNGWKKVLVSGSESMESIDLLGHLVPMLEEPIQTEKKGQGKLFEAPPVPIVSMRWKDGPLTEAFRRARSGEKVVLIYDELLRTPGRQLNILISALAPIGGHYILPTGKGVGIGTEGQVMEEVIMAPVANLWVIATTNVGAAYQVDTIDDALDDRFRTIRKDTNPALMEIILHSDAISQGYDPVSVKEKLIKFYQTMERLYSDGKLAKRVNQRHLSEAIHFSSDETDIGESLWETRYLWIENNIDGHPIAEQLDLVDMTIKKLFAAS